MPETPAGPRRPGFVAENSPAYLREKAIDTEHRLPPRIFGERSAHTFRTFQKESEEGGPMAVLVGEELQRGVFGRERVVIDVCLSGDAGEEMQYIARDFFEQGMRQPPVQERLKEITGKEEPHVQDAIGVFINGDMDDSLLADMIQGRVELYRGFAEQFERDMPELTAEFKEACEEAIAEGFLPIDSEAMHARVDETEVTIRDPLHRGPAQGGYSYWTISISPEQTKPEQRATLYHEYIHALSGRMVHIDEKEELVPASFRKLGIRFRKFETAQKRTALDMYVWLNEAITEYIAFLLHEDVKNVRYMKEVGELQQLMEDGVAEELFIAAYFENYDPDKPGHKQPALLALINRIKEVKGKEYLLDKEKEYA